MKDILNRRRKQLIKLTHNSESILLLILGQQLITDHFNKKWDLIRIDI